MKHNPVHNRPSRNGVAAVELALVLPLLLILLVGVWEVGRMIQVQITLNNACREGARIAAQGLIINRIGEATQIKVNEGDPNVTKTVLNYLREAGIKTEGVTVTFTFLEAPTSSIHPHEAEKGQRFRVEVTLPFQNVNWTLLRLTNVKTLTAQLDGESLVDDPFTIDTTIPQW